MRLMRKLVIVFVVATIVAIAADVVLIVTGHQDVPLGGADFVDYWPALAVLSDFVLLYGSKRLGVLLVRHNDESASKEHVSE